LQDEFAGSEAELVGWKNHHATMALGFLPGKPSSHLPPAIQMSTRMTSAMTEASPDRADACCGEIPVRMLPAVPGGIGYAGAFAGVIGHRLFAGGGANFPDGVMPWDGGVKVWHDTLHMLDLTVPGRGWKTVGRLPEPAGYGVALSTREGVVCIGGGNGDRHFSEVWLLALTVDGLPLFRSLPQLPTPLAQMSGALCGRRIHLCGGIEDAFATRASNAHWMLDLDALDQGWRKLPELPAAGRILATAAALNGDFHVIGGCSLAPDACGNPARSLLRDAWKFSGGEWTRLADLPHVLAASGSPAPVAGNFVFLVSGDDGSQTGLASPADHAGFSRRVLCYDSTRDRWSYAGNLGVTPPVTVPVAFWRGESIFFNGEVRPGVRTPSVFAFDASACIPQATRFTYLRSPVTPVPVA
jgi:N-acetylneuraminic acid mutarotase